MRRVMVGCWESELSRTERSVARRWRDGLADEDDGGTKGREVEGVTGEFKTASRTGSNAGILS